MQLFHSNTGVVTARRLTWLSAIMLSIVFLLGCKKEETANEADINPSLQAMENWEAELESELLTNRQSIGANLDLIAAGLSGVMKDPVITRIVRDYEAARRIKFPETPQLPALLDEFPFMHVSTLRQMCSAQGIDLVAKMQARLQELGFPQADIARLPSIVDAFPVSATYNYTVYPTIMMPFFTDSRTYEGWDGYSPVYVSRSQFRLADAYIPVYTYNIAENKVMITSLSDQTQLYKTPSWDVQIMLHKPLEKVQFILEHTGLALRAISSNCGCSLSSNNTLLCNNGGTSSPSEPSGCVYTPADHNCTGECTRNKDGAVVF